tara:strand:- start:3370 stop:3603 length:234 start_codon:yes stop_codon:yes gene_type:complete
MTLENSIALAYFIYMLREINNYLLDNSWNPKRIFEQFRDCLKCISFWVTLLVTQDLKLALLTSLAAYIIDSYIVTRL